MLNSILAMIVCIVMSGYFSATETAFSSLNKTRMKALAENGSLRAALALQLSENYDKLISTILIGNNIVNIAVASIGTVLFVQLMGQELGPAVSTAVITVVVLIFGEITPKSLAKDFPERFAMFSAPILKWIILIFTPLNYIFTQWKRLISKLFRSSDSSKMSQEELLILLDEVQQEGAIDADGGKLLRNAVEFGEMEAQDILTHRVDLQAVPVEATKAEVAQLFDETHLSRLLVYDQTLDNIVGVIHLKDFYTGGGMTSQELKDIVSPALFTHRTEKIADLLQELQEAKAHIAVVVDEFGGTLGVVTMEDILEELVGDIWDEHDEVEESIREISENTYQVDGSVALGDFCEQFLIETNSESVTVGGWVTEVMDCIPDVGQSFRLDNLDITIQEVSSHRVESILVCVLPETTEE